MVCVCVRVCDTHIHRAGVCRCVAVWVPVDVSVSVSCEGWRRVCECVSVRLCVLVCLCVCVCVYVYVCASHCVCSVAKYFIDILLTVRDDEDKGLTDKEIVDEVNTFMFEGHDTTSAGLLWSLYHVSQYPDHTAKLIKEIDNAFEEAKNPPYLDHGGIAKLSYMHLFLQESHRIIPPVPMIGRQLDAPQKFGKYTLPKGAMVGINPCFVHMNPDEWENPETFDPERFLPENSRKRHPYAWLAFSAGPRNCIGQKFATLEEKVVLSLLLRHFTISLEPGQNIKPFAELVMRNQDPVHFTLTPRSTTLMA
mmetsp:Transcript_21510/g.50935  ORF Transcript_21510/g.50935 Transcript_21510/m.50935 type:complete len:308 (+) Transcript_21510:3-926(+)